MKSLRIFLEMIKFEHSLFALPFAYLGLFLAEGGWPRWAILFWVTVAMVSFRTFAMAVNRLIDRQIDGQNPRTQMRALPQKKLTPRFVIGVSLLSLAVFEGSAWILGPLCFSLSPVPVFLAGVYPTLKRFTWLSHAVLGIILGIAPYGAWVASRGEFSWVPGLLLLGVASWVAGFDILYSLQDLEFDQKSKLHSIPVRFGKEQGLGTAAFLHFIAWVAWSGAGWLADLGWIYALGIGLVGIFLIREHFLIRRFGLAKIEEAFFSMNVGVSFAVFLATVLDLQLRKF